VAGLYPLMLNLQDKLCVIVGGGTVAKRKISGLLDGGANHLRIVSKELAAELASLLAAAVQANAALKLEVVQRAYAQSDLDGASLVFAATDQPDVNQAIAADAAAAGVWVNVANDGESGDFVTASTVRRGELLIGITTGGASPALAASIAADLRVAYGPEYAAKVELLRVLREYMHINPLPASLRAAVLKLAAAEVLDERSLQSGYCSENKGTNEETTVHRNESQLKQWLDRLLRAAGQGGNHK